MMAGLGDGGDAGSGGGTNVGSGGGGGNAGAGSGGGSAQGGSTGSGSGDSGAGNSAAGNSGSGNAGSGAAQGGNLGTGGSGQASWRDALPDELKADPTLSKYSDIQNLAKAHIELQKKFGQKGVFKPAEGASKEEIQAFREALGIPTDPTKYDLGKFDGVEVPKETLAWAQKLGAEHGIEPAALKAIMTDYMKVEIQNKATMAEAAKAEMKKGLEGLKTEWGDAYDRNLSRAEFAAKKLGGQALIDHMVKLGIHNDPTLLKSLSEAAKLYGEDKLREAGAGDGRQTPQEIDAEIAAVQGRLFAMKPTDGAYLGMKQRYESLWRTKTGGK